MIFGRVKPLDAILATAEKKSLHRSFGAVQLTLFVGCIIGTGIFVLTAVGAQKAQQVYISFIIAGAVCVVAALCYSEIASMVPVAGSAYTYSYAVQGEFLAWTAYGGRFCSNMRSARPRSPWAGRTTSPTRCWHECWG